MSREEYIALEYIHFNEDGNTRHINRINLKTWIIDNRLYFIGAIIGAIGGYFYWKYIGCNNGQCMIGSKPLNSSLYFAVLGALVFSLLKSKKK